ncbi:MAG TPA: rhodanese-like domain-containing protein, partial [Vicinamibacterales bacterium]
MKRLLTLAVVVLGVVCIALPFALRGRLNRVLAEHGPTLRPPAATLTTMPARPVARRLSLSDFMSLHAVDRALVVDVRSERSFSAGHIPGALNVPVGEVGARAPEILRLSAGRAIVTYCSCVHEHTSAVAAQTLAAAGAKDVS